MLLSNRVLSVALALALTACVKAPNTSVLKSREMAAPGIVGGTDASGSDAFAKSVVAILDVDQGSLCTGSIISDSIIVTAAHCVYESSVSDLRIMYGVDVNTDENIASKVDAFEVSAVYPIRKDEEVNAGDIALVHFSGGLLPGYKPARILNDVSVLQKGLNVLLAGYGLSNVSELSGGGHLRSVVVSVSNTAYSVSEILVDQTQGKGACHGDSGGPAYAKVGNELLLWGVTSHTVGDPNDECKGQAAYASIPHYAEWIETTAKKLNAQAQKATSRRMSH